MFVWRLPSDNLILRVLIHSLKPGLDSDMIIMIVTRTVSSNVSVLFFRRVTGAEKC